MTFGGAYTEQDLSEVKHYLPKAGLKFIHLFFFFKGLEEKILLRDHELQGCSGWSPEGRGGAVAPWRMGARPSFLDHAQDSRASLQSHLRTDHDSFSELSFFPVSTHFFRCVKSLTWFLHPMQELKSRKEPLRHPTCAPISLFRLDPPACRSPHYPRDSLTPNHAGWVLEIWQSLTLSPSENVCKRRENLGSWGEGRGLAATLPLRAHTQVNCGFFN